MPKSKSADRAAEMNRLLVEQGHVTRSMKYTASWTPTEDEQEVIRARAARLIELAEMLGQAEPEAYVNERLAAWLKMNPLSLGKRRVKAIIDDPASGNIDNTVVIQVGDPTNGGYHYSCLADDVSNHGGLLRFTVPDSVAEYFRQQGRRQLQRSIRGELGL